jgi:hypothetical protein
MCMAMDTTAREGWVFGGQNESCDSACAKYSTGWTCDVDELHTTVSKDTFLAARNAVLDCDFPNGDCEVERDISKSSNNYLYFPALYDIYH